jgi:Skp family chaperone for outer membrane proteins
MASMRQQNEINELRRRVEALEAALNSRGNEHAGSDRKLAALERARAAKAAKRETEHGEHVI